MNETAITIDCDYHHEFEKLELGAPRASHGQMPLPSGESYESRAVLTEHGVRSMSLLKLLPLPRARCIPAPCFAAHSLKSINGALSYVSTEYLHTRTSYL